MFVNISTPKFAAQAIKKMHELGWKPMHVMTDVSISIGAVMKPAGLDASEGVLSAGYLKDASDPQWKDDAGKEWPSSTVRALPPTPFGLRLMRSSPAQDLTLQRKPSDPAPSQRERTRCANRTRTSASSRSIAGNWSFSAQ